jgi:hypothetical protein
MPIPSQVQELIDGSGNNFHAKVARWFSSDGWVTTISPYYMDQSQQKARELDLIAEKVFPIKGSFGEWVGEVVIRLFIECKFLPGHSVFWFIDKDRAAIEEFLCSSGKFRSRNKFTAEHHYISTGGQIAKLFASSNARGQESEPFYKALNQSLNGLVSLRKQVPRAFTTTSRSRGFQVVLDYPIVVCNSFAQVYAADFAGQRETDLVSENFQLEVQYAYSDGSGAAHDELFIIDLVEFDQLAQFVELISKDAALAGFFAEP